MRRAFRYLLGAAITAGCLAYAMTYSMQTWPEVIGVGLGLLAGPLVALGPDIYGVDQITLPGGASVDFGDDDCDHDRGDQ